MFHTSSPIRLTEALVHADQHWQQQHKTGSEPVPLVFTVALSRETGTYGGAIAREVGNRLRWPVYDSELLQRVAEDLGVRRTLVESVDERQVGWLTECLEALSSAPTLSQSAYVHHLVETLLALTKHRDCVVVGRGATKVLPLASTLRVRLVAPLEHRVEAIRREHGISREEAARRVEATDRARERFVKEHFQMDSAVPRNYDLVLNVARFSLEECVALIIAQRIGKLY